MDYRIIRCDCCNSVHEYEHVNDSPCGYTMGMAQLIINGRRSHSTAKVCHECVEFLVANRGTPEIREQVLS